MQLSNETITLYNAMLDPTTGYDVFNKTVITGASWFCDIAATVTDKGLKAADKYTIRIPISADFGGKVYLNPIDYAQAGAPETSFTLREGDIIVKGAATEEHPRPAELHERYSEIATILTVTDNRRGRFEKHWKVVGA